MIMSMRQGDQMKQFSSEKKLHKIKNGFTINKHPEISYQLIDRIIK